ncbi:hypothetical protein PR048_005419 [Dryococelus australis]|uniref:Uncharacterized protein n=1 Tax=Dryococelus australis TaxID=614101 RepID=A0ABQ9IAB5_9NEOP|nr:hypothetical protein PR048_005419 [Dryococelus australis]
MEWLQEEWRRIPVDVLQTLVVSMPVMISDKLLPDDVGPLSYAGSGPMDGGKTPGQQRLDSTQLKEEHCTLTRTGDEHLYAKTRLGKVKEVAGIAERRMEGARVCEAELGASSSHQTVLGRARSAARLSSTAKDETHQHDVLARIDENLHMDTRELSRIKIWVPKFTKYALLSDGESTLGPARGAPATVENEHVVWNRWRIHNMVILHSKDNDQLYVTKDDSETDNIEQCKILEEIIGIVEEDISAGRRYSPLKKLYEEMCTRALISGTPGSGWTESLIKDGIASQGIAEGIPKAAHVTNTRYAHQVTYVARHTLLHEAHIPPTPENVQEHIVADCIGISQKHFRSLIDHYMCVYKCVLLAIWWERGIGGAVPWCQVAKLDYVKQKFLLGHSASRAAILAVGICLRGPGDCERRNRCELDERTDHNDRPAYFYVDYIPHQESNSTLARTPIFTK